MNDSTSSTSGSVMQTTVKITVPITLNIRWMIVVRFAFRLVPMDARTAVMQVPMFCPNSTYTALSSPIRPPAARACRMPTDAEEDWMMAVKIMPARIPSTGLANFVIRLMNASESRSGIMELLIISMPMNRMPSPATICP